MNFRNLIALSLLVSAPLISVDKIKEIPSLNIAAGLCLKQVYLENAAIPTDINEHLPTLKDLASQCSSVTEIGTRSMVSTWGILQGLVEGKQKAPSYLGIDLDLPPREKIWIAKCLAEENGIQFKFWQTDDTKIVLPKTDLLFIDSLHTYCHLTYELETFSPRVTKYIAMHDTSAPWGHRDDVLYAGDRSEYPDSYNKQKRGLWPAVQDFLTRHPEWKLEHRYENNHGFTILKRVKETNSESPFSKCCDAVMGCFK